jgi:hypothetical protein
VLYIANKYLYKNIDKGILEIFGPFGILNFVKWMYTLWNKLNSGNLNHYIVYMLSIVVFYFIFVKGYHFEVQVLMFLPFIVIKKKLIIHKLYFTLIFRHLISYYFTYAIYYGTQLRNKVNYWHILKDKTAWTRELVTIVDEFEAHTKYEDEDDFLEDALDEFEPEIFFYYPLDRYSDVASDWKTTTWSNVFDKHVEAYLDIRNHGTWIWMDNSHDLINLQSTLFLTHSYKINEEKIWDCINEHGPNNKWDEIHHLPFLTDIDDELIDSQEDWDDIAYFETVTFYRKGYHRTLMFYEDLLKYSLIRWAWRHPRIDPRKHWFLSSHAMVNLGWEYQEFPGFSDHFKGLRRDHKPLWRKLNKTQRRYKRFWKKVVYFHKRMIKKFLSFDLYYILIYYNKYEERIKNQKFLIERKAISWVGGDIRDFGVLADQMDFPSDLYDKHW